MSHQIDMILETSCFRIAMCSWTFSMSSLCLYALFASYFLTHHQSAVTFSSDYMVWVGPSYKESSYSGNNDIPKRLLMYSLLISFDYILLLMNHSLEKEVDHFERCYDIKQLKVSVILGQQIFYDSRNILTFGWGEWQFVWPVLDMWGPAIRVYTISALKLANKYSKRVFSSELTYQSIEWSWVNSSTWGETKK